MLRAGRITEVNRRGAALVARPVAEVLHRPIDDLLAAGEAERLDALTEQDAASWPSVVFRLSFVRPNGEDISTEVLMTRAPGGSTVLVARDVRGGRRGERLVASLAAVCGRVPPTHGPGALLEACAEIFTELAWTLAYSAIDVDGESIIPLQVLGATADPIAEYGRSLIGTRVDFAQSPIAAEVVRTGRPIFLENLPTLSQGCAREATTLDAAMRTARVRRSAWIPIFREAAPTHVLAVAGPDVTEHDFVALQLFGAQLGAALRAQELEAELLRREGLAAMGRMSAVLAHEIRTPLAVIFNALSALAQKRDAEELNALHAIIGEEARRLRNVTSEILDFARPREPCLTDVAVRTLADDAIAAALQHPSVVPGVPRPSTVVESEVDHVHADAELLRRALVNLLVNAITHSPPHAQVRVRASREGARVRIRVENEGRPIPVESACRVFEAFFTTQAQGIGLGLFVVKRAIEACHGEVSLDPTNEGAAFSLWLDAS